MTGHNDGPKCCGHMVSQTVATKELAQHPKDKSIHDREPHFWSTRIWPYCPHQTQWTQLLSNPIITSFLSCTHWIGFAFDSVEEQELMQIARCLILESSNAIGNVKASGGMWLMMAETKFVTSVSLAATMFPTCLANKRNDGGFGFNPSNGINNTWTFYNMTLVAPWLEDASLEKKTQSPPLHNHLHCAILIFYIPWRWWNARLESNSEQWEQLVKPLGFPHKIFSAWLCHLVPRMSKL